MCLAATGTRALKTVVQAMLLADASKYLDPISLLCYMSSISCVMLIPATALLEPGAFAKTQALIRSSPLLVVWIISNAILAFAVNLTNFFVTKFTSALTLQVLGNMKGIVATIVSVCVFHNQVNIYGWLGYALTTGGVFAYSESKRRCSQ